MNVLQHIKIAIDIELLLTLEALKSGLRTLYIHYTCHIYV